MYIFTLGIIIYNVQISTTSAIKAWLSFNYYSVYLIYKYILGTDSW